jgi:hypothetical protein
MNSTPSRKTTQPTEVLIVRADERPAPAYQQIAHADYQQIAHAGELFVHVTEYTPNPTAIESEERLAHASEQIARVDEQLAQVTERLSRLEHDIARHSSAAPGHQPSRGWPALRGPIGLLSAVGIFAAAFASQSSYSDATKLMIARWATQLGLTSLLPQTKLGLNVQASSAADQVAAAESPLPTLSAQTAQQEVAPTVATLSPELVQMHETSARDLANVEQVVGQLKTSQEQMARDHAKAFEQLKTNQEQISRGHAKAFEQLKTSQEQLARDQAKAIEQLKTNQEQLARDNVKVAEQLKASQEQMASFTAKASEQSRRPKASAPPPRPIAPPQNAGEPKIVRVPFGQSEPRAKRVPGGRASPSVLREPEG